MHELKYLVTVDRALLWKLKLWFKYCTQEQIPHVGRSGSFINSFM